MSKASNSPQFLSAQSGQGYPTGIDFNTDDTNTFRKSLDRVTIVSIVTERLPR